MTRPDKTSVTLTVLGSGTCAPTRSRSTACYHIAMGGKSILMDIGFGSLRRLLEADIDYREIDYLLITHTHLDHCGDYGPLLMALNYTPGLVRKKPLTVIGPPGLIDHLNGLGRLHGDWLTDSEMFDIRFVELDRSRASFDDWFVSALPMHHSPPANGYRLEFGNRVLAYSGDTGNCDSVVELLKMADIALLECSNPDGDAYEYHLTPAAGGQIAARSNCRHLILTHFYPNIEGYDIVSSCSRFYKGNITLAQDFMKVSI